MCSLGFVNPKTAYDLPSLLKFRIVLFRTHGQDCHYVTPVTRIPGMSDFSHCMTTTLGTTYTKIGERKSEERREGKEEIQPSNFDHFRTWQGMSVFNYG